MSQAILKSAQEGMEKSIKALQQEIGRMRTGRASLAMLDDIRVDYYGQMMPIAQVATLAVPEPRMITVAPWEQNLIPALEKAIEKANLGIKPVNDGKLIRLPIPMLTTERRQDLVKQLKGHGEESKVSIRHVRREALDLIKKQEKEGLAEDESKKLQTQIQKLTDDYTAKVDATLVKKEAEIMQV